VLFRHLESRVAKALLHLDESATLHGFRVAIELHVSQRELGNFAAVAGKALTKYCRAGTGGLDRARQGGDRDPHLAGPSSGSVQLRS